MKNSVLLINYNFSEHVGITKDFIFNLYSKYFKKIVFYSDMTVNESDSDVCFIDQHCGYFAYISIVDYLEKQAIELNDIDGLFFLMDDCLLNPKKINLLDSSKIICCPTGLKDISEYKGWWWDAFDGIYGRLPCNKIQKEIGLNKFGGTFSDFIYLPKKYFKNFINFGKFFYENKVFLEIAIPSIIYNLESDTKQFNQFASVELWGDDRLLINQEGYIENKMRSNLFLHPIKFSDVEMQKKTNNIFNDNL